MGEKRNASLRKSEWFTDQIWMKFSLLEGREATLTKTKREALEG